MAHLEMSLTEPFAVPASELADLRRTTSSRARSTIGPTPSIGATEPCIVIDAKAVVAAASPAACRLLGFADRSAAVGACLHDGVPSADRLRRDGEPAAGHRAGQDPAGAGATRPSVSRAGCCGYVCGGDVVTIDAVATPLLEGGHVVGSLTFFCTV